MFIQRKVALAALLGVLTLAWAACSVVHTGGKRSLLLYESAPADDSIVNWVVDMDTGEKWQVGDGRLITRGWSPSGKHMLFYAYDDSRLLVEVSDAVGNEMRRVFDANDYPDIDVENVFWAAGDILLFNTFDTKQRRSLIYTLDVESGAFKVLTEGGIDVMSPDGSIWLYGTLDGKGGIDYYLMNLAGERSLVTLGDRRPKAYYFSPDGKQWAYFCNEGNARRSSYRLCLADVSAKDGVRNKRLLIHEELSPNQIAGVPYVWWAPDGRYIGVRIFNVKTREEQLRVIDVGSGQVVFSRLFPTKTARGIWSPRGDQVVDRYGVWLDLQSGEVRDFFAEIQETVPARVVDWRLIEVSP